MFKIPNTPECAGATYKIGKATGNVDWVLFFAFVVIILLSGVVQYFNIFALASLNVVLQYILLRRIAFRFSRKIAKAFVFVFVYLIYSFTVLQDIGDIVFIVYRFHDILTALLLLNYIVIRQSNFERTFVAVLMFFMLHGYLNWLVVTFAFNLFAGDPSIIKSFRFLVFFGMEEQYLGIYRSQGLFWEPGVYQIYLNIALHYFLFYARRYLWAALALLGVILTLSTTGVVIAGLQIAYFAFINRGQGALGKIILITMVLPAMLFYVNFASIVVEDKVVGEKSGSFLSRSFDTQNGIAVALAHPFGIGFNPETYLSIASANPYGIDTPLITDRGQTNGVLILAYSTGLLWAAAVLFLTYKQRIFPKHRILFFIVLVGSMSTEPLFYSPFVFLFVLSGLIRFFPLERVGAGSYKMKNHVRNVNVVDVT